jgi:putative flippase GtrA
MKNNLILRYAFVGGFCFVIDFLIFIFLLEIFLLSWYAGLFISFVIATYINYYLSRNYVFVKNYSKKKSSQLIYTFLVSIGTLCLNYIFIFTLHEIFYFHVYLSKFISIFFGFIINFIARKKFIFV